MLYVPSPYSSGTDVSVCEQDKYSVSTPPSPPCGLATSDSYNNKETSDYSTPHESPPLTPKQLLESDSEAQLLDQPPATSNDGDEELFFLGPTPAATQAVEEPLQEQHEDYLLYDHSFEPDYQHLPEQGPYTFEPFDQSLYSTPSITDDDFETANRAFHATINKFSRQNYPDHRKRTPYNFLENWHLHSMYSKSQQILLGIPHVRPTVLLSGDDFMFTPPLLQQEEEEEYMEEHHPTDHHYLDQSIPMEWMDDGQMFEDDGEILDDGIVIMSAPDPPLIMTPTTTPTCTVMNENAWMRNHLDFPSQHYQLDHMDDDMDDRQQQQQQQQQQQEDASTSVSNLDNDPFYFAGGLTSELLHWYRTSDRGRPPSTIMENRDNDDDIDEQVSLDGNNNNEDMRQSTTTTTISEEKQPTIVSNHSYQSLADIVTSSSTSPQQSQEPPQQYGATTHDRQQKDTPPLYTSSKRWINHRTIGMTDQLATTSDLILTMASDYRLEGKNTTLSFISCMIRIWKILFLTAELMLASLWGQQPLMVTGSRKPAAKQPILPF